MALLTDAEIEKIKADTDLAAVVRSRGVALTAKGGDLIGLCPFHDDKSPSLHVTPGKRLWRCVSCNATGNVIQFVQRFDGVSFRHAADLLAGGAAFKAPPTCGPVKKSTVPKLANPLAGVAASVPPTSATAGGDAAALDPAAEHAADQEALRRVVDYYAERLAANPAALRYLEKRGLADPDLLRVFRVGFCDRTLGLRLPQKNRAEGAALRARLVRLGVMRESGHEHFRGQITVPVLGDGGAVGTIYGRAAGVVPKENRHRFLPGPQAGVFNRAALSPEALRESGGALILTEGITDALTWWAHGFRHVTTCFSARKPSPEVIEAICRAGVRVAFLAFDPDGAGESGTEGAAALLLARGVEVRRVRFPHGHDANSYALAVSPPRQALGVLLNAAEWLGKGQGVAAHVAPAPSSLAAKAAKAADASASASAGEPSPSVAAPTVAAKEKTASPVAPSSGSPTSTTTPTASNPAAPSAASSTPPPTPSPASPSLVQRGELWFLDLAEPAREYRLCGLEKLSGFEVLKLTVRLRVGERFHLDALDLARDGERRRYVERAAEECALHADLLRRDLGRLLLAVEAWLTARAASEAAKTSAPTPGATTAELTPQERAEALAWAKAPGLVGRLREAFRLAGIVGEEIPVLIGYLCGVSRLLPKPLAAIIQSPSAAGKTTVMDAVLAFFPEEHRVKYSAMTGQSLFYMGDFDLRHKILAIVEEAGAEKASYALKLLQSEQELRIASTGKNPQTGRMETQEYHVKGPVMIMLTTTAIDLDEELQNRCLTLAVDDSPEQTARIHAAQRERRTLAGLVAQAERADLLRLMKNVQRLLEPLEVLNDHAPRLTFPVHQTRNRRDNEKYLTLIDSIALLHQHQRGRGTRTTKSGKTIAYIEATLEDIALANQLAPEVLGRSLDELPPQSRRLLDHIRALVRTKAARDPGDGTGNAIGNGGAGAPPAASAPGPASASATSSPISTPPISTRRAREDATFTRRELQEACGWSFTQLRVHLERLVEQEYLATKQGRFGSLYVYELLIDADAPANVAHIRLIDVENLRRAPNLAGLGIDLAGVNGHLAGGDALPPRGANTHDGSALGSTSRPDRNAHQEPGAASAA